MLDLKEKWHGTGKSCKVSRFVLFTKWADEIVDLDVDWGDDIRMNLKHVVCDCVVFCVYLATVLLMRAIFFSYHNNVIINRTTKKSKVQKFFSELVILLRGLPVVLVTC
jgi:hypothetical protein